MNGDTHSDTKVDWNPTAAQDPGEYVPPTFLGGVGELPRNITKVINGDETSDQPMSRDEKILGLISFVLLVAAAAYSLLGGHGCSAGPG